MSERRGPGNNSRRNADQEKFDLPKNSRLFVVASKEHTDEVFRKHFSAFEGFEDVCLVLDRRTGEKKGVAYVKFAKASQAGKAMEETDGTVIGGIGRSVKVKVAQSRQSGSTRDFDEDEELTRIFIMVPKTYKDTDIRDKFGGFGRITKVHQILDKVTGDKKGFAYVKYSRMFEAATAIENSDPDFKAVWAEPRQDKIRNRDDHRRDHNDRDGRRDGWDRPGRERGGGHERGYEYERPPEPRRRETSYEAFGDSYYRAPRDDYYYYPAATPSASASDNSLGGGYEDVTQHISSTTTLPANATSRLQVDVTGKVTEQQLYALFNIVPGLEYCDFREEGGSWGGRGTAHVRYKSAVFAAYARSKMNGLQYPEVHPLMIQFMGAPEASRTMGSPPLMASAPVLSGPTYSRPAAWPPANNHAVCSVELPAHQPLAPYGSEVKERLFVILTRSLPDHIIQDAFCRFGQLIEYRTIKGRNYGFAKFADAECARHALDTLHGEELNGERMKVVIAEPEKNPQNKRPRTD